MGEAAGHPPIGDCWCRCRCRSALRPGPLREASAAWAERVQHLHLRSLDTCALGRSDMRTLHPSQHGCGGPRMNGSTPGRSVASVVGRRAAGCGPAGRQAPTRVDGELPPLRWRPDNRPPPLHTLQRDARAGWTRIPNDARGGSRVSCSRGAASAQDCTRSRCREQTRTRTARACSWNLATSGAFRVSTHASLRSTCHPGRR